jgi:GT2 family glycosyltransferase
VQPQRHLPLVGVSGGAALIPAEAWKAADGLWEDYFAWGEDVDMALRLWKGGWRTELVDMAPLAHAGGHSIATTEGARRKARLLARNRWMLWSRLVDTRLAMLLSPAWVAGTLALCAVHAREHTFAATTHGVVDGWRQWARARRTTDPSARLNTADWRRLWSAS